jgi:PAS domain S-box-containing protein
VDNSRVAVEVSAVPVVFHGDRGALVFVRDISERKRMDEKVRQLSRAVEQSPVSIVITNKDGNIEYVNRKFTDVTGYSFSEVIGKNPRILKSGELPAKVYQQMWECIRDGQEWRCEFHNRKKNGELFWELSVISPIFNAAGAITHYLAVKEDITERKQLEERLRQSQKMEAFGQLAGGIAHDFNNLLTIIQGNVALLQEPLNSDQAGGLVEIAKAAERAANLTRQLLTFSRRQIFQPKPLDLNEIVANTSKMLQRIIGEHIGLETHFAPGGAPITADRNMMEQILINLAVNSRDAMPKGGRLIIQTAAITISETGAAANPKARPGAFIRLSVTDTGCGIAPKEMEHVFEPFFTTKEIGKGTGLGLATVFGIVTQHHGWIEVKTKVNEGATFHIHLPRLAETESALAELSRPSNVRGGNETILLVEDEAPVRSLARTILEQKGYHIIEADSGLSALEIWQQQRDAIDLLFTDMVMPEGISGRELAARLLAEKPGLKVIYSSGYTDDMLGESSPLRNNPNFLEKPFSPHKLLKQVRDCLDGVASSDR